MIGTQKNSFFLLNNVDVTIFNLCIYINTRVQHYEDAMPTFVGPEQAQLEYKRILDEAGQVHTKNPTEICQIVCSVRKMIQYCNFGSTVS